MPRTSRLAVGGPAGETTDFDADYKFSVATGTHATYSCCLYRDASTPQQQSVLLGGGSAMGLGVQGGYRAVCGRSSRSSDRLARTLDNHTTLGAHLNTLGAVPLTLPPVPVWALAGTLR